MEIKVRWRVNYDPDRCNYRRQVALNLTGREMGETDRQKYGSLVWFDIA